MMHIARIVLRRAVVTATAPSRFPCCGTPRSQDVRRGAMLPLIGVLLPVMLVFLGFAIDLAYMQTTRMELQAVADSASRAGANALSETDDPAVARARARSIAAQNEVAGAPMQLRDSEIEVGRAVRTGTGKFQFALGGTPANSVRVTANRTSGSLSGAVPLFFGALIGRQSFEPVTTATASFLNVDICVVLDRSSSMKLRVTGESGGMFTSDPRFCANPNAASRWLALDGAMQVFLGELADSDAVEKVAIASYAGEATFVMPCGSLPSSSLDAPLSTDLNAAASAVSHYTTSVWNGNTAIESGMRTGLAELRNTSRTRTGAEKVMILLTDGRENIGSAMSAARDCAAADVVVHTITFSDDAEQTLMTNVAATTGGQHFHANTAAELRNVFRELAAQSTRLTE